MNRINFLPERIRRKRYCARQVRRHVTVLILLALALAGIGAVGHMKVSAADFRLDGYNRELASLSERLAIVPELQKQIAEGRIKLRISEEVGSSVPVTKLLMEISRQLPKGACLTGLELGSISSPRLNTGKRVTKAKVAQAEIRPHVLLTLNGLAPTNVELAEFMATLSNSPMFENIRMGYSRTVEVDGGNRQACKYEVICTVTQ